MNIALHLELAPSCPPAALEALLGRLQHLGFKVEDGAAGLLIARKCTYPSVDMARKAIGKAVTEAGAVLLDSRVFLLRRKRRRKRMARRGPARRA